MTFDIAFQRLIGHEGGLSDHPSDPGGLTKFGISKRSYPNEDIRALTIERAKAIYLRDFWEPAGCDDVPEGIAFDLFDMAVNSGVRRAVMTLQRSIGARTDGVMGPVTMTVLNSLPSAVVVAKFNGARLEFMAELPTWPAFGRGWAKRIASNLMAVR